MLFEFEGDGDGEFDVPGAVFASHVDELDWARQSDVAVYVSELEVVVVTGGDEEVGTVRGVVGVDDELAVVEADAVYFEGERWVRVIVRVVAYRVVHHQVAVESGVFDGDFGWEWWALGEVPGFGVVEGATGEFVVVGVARHCRLVSSG